MRPIAIIKHLGSAGMGLLRLAVIRQADGEKLATYTYDPDSPASSAALDEYLADVQGRHQVEIVE